MELGGVGLQITSVRLIRGITVCQKKNSLSNSQTRRVTFPGDEVTITETGFICLLSGIIYPGFSFVSGDKVLRLSTRSGIQTGSRSHLPPSILSPVGLLTITRDL